jgi:hypothetical protein
MSTPPATTEASIGGAKVSQNLDAEHRAEQPIALGLTVHVEGVDGENGG